VILLCLVLLQLSAAAVGRLACCMGCSGWQLVLALTPCYFLPPLPSSSFPCSTRFRQGFVDGALQVRKASPQGPWRWCRLDEVLRLL
jgi:hypothetical protein